LAKDEVAKDKVAKDEVDRVVEVAVTVESAESSWLAVDCFKQLLIGWGYFHGQTTGTGIEGKLFKSYNR
jgi:hypothetical protein